MWLLPIESEDIFIPTGDHPGAFGAVRKHDIHTGVDIYCPERTPVYAVEDGKRISSGWFTGKNTIPPTEWWDDTKYLILEGQSGFVLYGEIEMPMYIIGIDYYRRGDLVGWVTAVLPPHRVRPDIPYHSNSMLHIELHHNVPWQQGFIWNLGEEKPKNLVDPTPYLLTNRGENITMTDEELVRLALSRGWVLDGHYQKCTLYLPRDISNGWAAEWKTIEIDDYIILFPHWLQRRMEEIENE